MHSIFLPGLLRGFAPTAIICKHKYAKAGLNHSSKPVPWDQGSGSSETTNLQGDRRIRQEKPWNARNIQRYQSLHVSGSTASIQFPILGCFRFFVCASVCRTLSEKMPTAHRCGSSTQASTVAQKPSISSKNLSFSSSISHTDVQPCSLLRNSQVCHASHNGIQPQKNILPQQLQHLAASEDCSFPWFDRMGLASQTCLSRFPIPKSQRHFRVNTFLIVRFPSVLTCTKHRQHQTHQTSPSQKICTSIYLSTYLSIHPSIYLSIYLSN